MDDTPSAARVPNVTILRATEIRVLEEIQKDSESLASESKLKIATVFRFPIHQVEQIAISRNQELGARFNRCVEIGFVVRVAWKLEAPRNVTKKSPFQQKGFEQLLYFFIREKRKIPTQL
jgi:hypothetical protein